MEALTTEEQAIAKEFADITVTEPVTEPVVEPVAEPVTEPVAEPVTEAYPSEEPVEKPKGEPVENENSDTYKKRWASLNGMIVSEKERGKIAQKRIAELEAQL